jgi:hypothetical protein
MLYCWSAVLSQATSEIRFYPFCEGWASLSALIFKEVLATCTNAVEGGFENVSWTALWALCTKGINIFVRYREDILYYYLFLEIFFL